MLAVRITVAKRKGLREGVTRGTSFLDPLGTRYWGREDECTYAMFFCNQAQNY